MKQRLSNDGEQKESELLVFVKVKDLASYILLINGKSPVKYRYSLLNPLINKSLSGDDYELTIVSTADNRLMNKSPVAE